MPFPTPLGNRIAYDRDGTAVLVRKESVFGGGWLNVHHTAVQAMNSSEGAGMFVPLGPEASIWRDNRDDNGLDGRVALIFPEPMQLSGIFVQTLRRSYPDSFGATLNWSTPSVSIRASESTTNGIDGVWTAVPGEFLSVSMFDLFGATATTDSPGNGTGVRADTGGALPVQQPLKVKDAYRHAKADAGMGAQSVNLRNIRGITLDVTVGGGIFGSYDENDRIGFFLHLYGHPDTLSTGPVLSAWHPTLDIRVPPGYLVWPDDARPSSASKTFRIKNLSMETATGILVSASDEYAALSPSPATQLQFSLDGSTWSSTVTIGSMSPGALSSVIHLRRTTPADSPLGSHSVRIDLTVGSWS